MSGLCVPSDGTVWLLSIHSELRATAHRLGFFGALVCTVALHLFLRGASSAYIVQLLNESHRACRYAGQALLLPGSLLFFSHACSYQP